MNRRWIKTTALMLVMVASPATGAPGDNVLPADTVKPCERHVQVEKITRLTIPMVPFRGVNLVFPFELDTSDTVYSLSSENTWTYNKAAGSNIVPISFTQFQDEWGELADFTIKHGDYLFSMTLQADPNLKNHCTNIVFEFSEEQREKMQQKERKEYLADLKERYDKKMERLDEKAQSRALELVGSLAQTEPEYSDIHTYETTEFENGDQVELYVTELQDWGDFSVVMAEVSNYSDIKSLYLQELTVGQLQNESKQPISGAVEMDKKLAPDGTGQITFTTLKSVPYTGGYAALVTNRGEVEVKW